MTCAKSVSTFCMHARRLVLQRRCVLSSSCNPTSSQTWTTSARLHVTDPARKVPHPEYATISGHCRTTKPWDRKYTVGSLFFPYTGQKSASPNLKLVIGNHSEILVPLLHWKQRHNILSRCCCFLYTENGSNKFLRSIRTSYTLRMETVGFSEMLMPLLH